MIGILIGLIGVIFQSCQGKNLIVDNGIPTSFNFGETGTFVNETFAVVVSPNTNVYLLVWDCYCPGDRFQIYDQNNNLLGVTNICETSSNGIPVDQTCKQEVYADNAQTCLNSPVHCRTGLYSDNPAVNLMTLMPGVYNLTIKVEVSYANIGSAFIGAYTVCGNSICCEDYLNCENVGGQVYTPPF